MCHTLISQLNSKSLSKPGFSSIFEDGEMSPSEWISGG